MKDTGKRKISVEINGHQEVVEVDADIADGIHNGHEVRDFVRDLLWDSRVAVVFDKMTAPNYQCPDTKKPWVEFAIRISPPTVECKDCNGSGYKNYNVSPKKREWCEECWGEGMFNSEELQEAEA